MGARDVKSTVAKRRCGQKDERRFITVVINLLHGVLVQYGCRRIVVLPIEVQ